MNILDKIVEFKRKEIVSSKEVITLTELKSMPEFNRQCYSITESICDPGKTGIIAEFKRKSPSKGIINDQVSVADISIAYSQYGAAALSVLTDFNFFGGSIDDLQEARKHNEIPILRKDFIVDTYQIYEAKAIGADVILLIAAILNKNEVSEFSKLAHDLGLQVLMEIHSEDELLKTCDTVDLIGINNRNLKTFEVNLEHSKQLVKKIPEKFIKISESGISHPNTIKELKKEGFQGFLIGESFMRSENPALAFKHFVEELE